MKRIYFLLLIFALAFAGCKKSEKLDANVVSITGESVVVEFYRATINASYSCDYELKSVKVLYADNEKLDNSISKSVSFSNGNMTVVLENLKMNTKYYYQYKFFGDYNSVTSEIRSFVTSGYSLPTVISADIQDVTMSTALGGGSVVDDGGDAGTTRGVCWSTNENPTINDKYTSDGTGIGDFVSYISELNDNTIYFVRAYAKNGAGVAYGEQKTIKTLYNPGYPIVTTKNVSEITQTNAVCGGNVISSATLVTERGVCWSKSEEPSVADNHTIDGNGLGNFNSIIEGLEPDMKYYVRAYAINQYGVNYGETKTFVTAPIVVELPVVITKELTIIDATTAKCGGEVISDGNSAVTQRGICWCVHPKPTIDEGSFSIEGQGIGSFESIMEYLQPNKTYYARAYATNSKGTAYGEDREFTIPEK